MRPRQTAWLSILWCLAIPGWAQSASSPVEPLSQDASAASAQVAESASQAAPTAGVAEGLIHLDVVVTDKSGKPVTGLKASDFNLLDNGQPSKILSFQAFDGVSARPDPAVEVILVIDTIDLPDRLATYEKQEVERFLREHGGDLAQPVSLFWLSDTGLWTLAQPSGDGNALADQMDHNKRLLLSRRTLRSQIGEPLNSLTFADPPGMAALKALSQIATDETQKPGRKLLLWVGPGWGMGSGKHFFSKLDREELFAAIGRFSTLMREARLVLYSFSVGEADLFDLTTGSAISPSAALYQEFLKGVQSEREASIDNLDRKVLAVQSGGRVLEPTDDLTTDIMHTGLTDRTPAFNLAGQIESCVEEANDFYRLSFNPSPTDRVDEYRSLEVHIAEPGLTARTNTGYYDQADFYDRLLPAARQVTVEQLEKTLAAVEGHRDGETARQLTELELTERLSDAELSSLESGVRGAKAHAALVELADASEFLPPPAAEIPADAAPDLKEQQRIIALTVDYLRETMPKLPNFFATRVTAHYEETPEHYEEKGRNRIDYEPLHWVKTSKATVLYRRGNEVLESAAKNPRPEDTGLITEGTFGPILGAVSDAISVPGSLTWSRWERGAGGLRAVFRYKIPQGKSRFQVGFCCLLEGDGTTRYEKLTGYHGEVAIDPENGTILRLTLEADLEPNLPLARSGLMMEYGQVVIGGKAYVCPVKSVSIARARVVWVLTGISDSFRVYGPYQTMVNDVSFQNYHIFRTETRVLPGTDAAPVN
jgi:VWFA-related protein